jgi:hypothetical protein
MGRANPKPKAKPKPKPKAASPVVIPPAATRKRAKVPDEHETDKCKALKGDLDEEHRPKTDVLKGALEEDKPDEVVDEEVVEEDNGATEAVKEAEGVSAMDDSEYHHPIGIVDATYTLVFTNNFCILTFYLCGTRLFVERTFCGTHSSCFCGKCLFVEGCNKETTTTQEVVNNNKGDEEKVEEVSKLALVQVVNDMADVEKEPSKVPPQQAKHLQIAATKTKKSLRLKEQNALATAKKKDKLEAQKIAVNRRKKRELEQVKIALQQKKERE